MCCESRGFGALRCAVLCLVVRGMYYCLLLSADYGTTPHGVQDTTTDVNGSSHDKQNHRQVQLGMAWLSVCLSLRCHAYAHVMPCRVREACEISRTGLHLMRHINMTYVPYLHPAAVGPFRFAGYCICMLHVAWHGSESKW